MSDINEPWTDIGYKTIGERISEKDAEIARLKATIGELRKLITELADALVTEEIMFNEDDELIQRAREATR